MQIPAKVGSLKFSLKNISIYTVLWARKGRLERTITTWHVLTISKAYEEPAHVFCLFLRREYSIGRGSTGEYGAGA